MRPAVGVSASTRVLTPKGPARACDLARGDRVIVIRSDGGIAEAAIRRVDRGLCCSVARFSVGGASVVAGRDTDFGDPARSVLDGVAEEGQISKSRLHFCLHAIHFYCDDGSFVLAGEGNGHYVAVSASFMEKKGYQ
jgi:hypothetical protein